MSDQSRHESEPEQPGVDADADASASAASTASGPEQAPEDAVQAADADAQGPDAAAQVAAADAAVVPPAPTVVPPAPPVVPPAPPAATPTPPAAVAPPAPPAAPPSASEPTFAPPSASEPMFASPASPTPASAASVPPAASAPPAPGAQGVPLAPGAPAAPPVPGAGPVPPAPGGASLPPSGPPASAPAAPAAPVGPVGPVGPSSASVWLAPFSRRVLLGALSHIGIAVAAAFVGGLILLAMLLTLGNSDAGSTPVGSVGDILDGFSMILGLLFSLTAAVFGGELTVGIGGDLGIVSGGGSVSIWVFPLTLTAAALAAVLWWGVRQGRSAPLPTRLHRVAYSVAVGLVTGLVLLVIALIFTVRVDVQGLGFSLSAAGYRVVLFSTVLVGAAAYLGRAAGALAPPREIWTSAVARLLRAAPRAAREWLGYTAFGAAVFGVLGMVFIIVKAWDGVGASAIGVGLVGVLNAAPFAAAIGHLGGITIGGALNGADTASSTLTVFNADEATLWIAVLAAVLLTVFIALWIGIRRPRAHRIDWRSAWQLPTLVFGTWLIVGSIFFGAGIGASGAAGMFGGSLTGGVGIALWSSLIFLIWAALVEIGAQTLPRVAYGIAPKALGAVVGRSALAAWVAGTSTAAAAASTVDASSAATFTGGAGTTLSAPIAPGTASAVDPTAAPLPEPAPLSPATKRGLIIGAAVVGGLVVLGIAASVAVGVVNSTRSPEAVAQQYLELIAEGKAEAANALVDPNVSESERQFLTDEVLAAATERISEVSVTDSQNIGDRAMVAVSYKLDGTMRETYLEALKGDPEWLVLDNWTLSSSLAAPVSFYVSGTGSVSLGGVPVDFTDSQGSAVLYPGVYKLTDEESKYFALQNTKVLAEAGVGGMVDLEFTPTEALRDAVASEVDALLTKCAAETSADPEGCPFSAYTYNDDTKVTWTLKGEPTIEISRTGEQVDVSGEAVASYSEEFFGTTRDRDDEERYSMYGEISVDGDKVTLDFEGSWW